MQEGYLYIFLTVANTVKSKFFDISLIIPYIVSHISIFLFYHMCCHDLHRTCRLIIQPDTNASILVFF